MSPHGITRPHSFIIIYVQMVCATSQGLQSYSKYRDISPYSHQVTYRNTEKHQDTYHFWILYFIIPRDAVKKSQYIKITYIIYIKLRIVSRVMYWHTPYIVSSQIRIVAPLTTTHLKIRIYFRLVNMASCVDKRWLVYDARIESF